MEGKSHQEPKSVALVVGVTGMAGLAIAEALKSPSAMGGPWKVYGSARRPKPDWFPSPLVDQYISFDALDLADTEAKLSSISLEITHVFWVALQVRQLEEEIIDANSLMLSNVLKVLTTQKKSVSTSSIDKVLYITLQTGTIYYIGPIHTEGNEARLDHEPPFREEMERLPYPNFYYALEDVVRSYDPRLTYSIHRPSIIFGASTRSTYNFLLTAAVYAEICKYRNVPFRYPGSRYNWEHFCDMTDTRILAEQHVWAAVNREAQNEAFNCTNGDVFTWKRMWRVLCEEFGVEFQPLDDDYDEMGFDLAEEMKDKGHVWDSIVEEKGLMKTKMEEITCFAALQTVLNFKFQLVSSMNKSKEFGFLEFVDSIKSVRFWVAKLRDMNIIP
uniref:PRISE-like Rossmann-fold domain-containing protein n=1 Tax=Opuntia streptacantha TaxID=393608 RepID=A0A7C8Z697_OPUST